MSERRVVLIAGAVVLVAGLVLAVAFVTKDRVFRASVPQPPPLEKTDVVPLPAGRSVCIEQITILPTSERAQFRVGTGGKPPVPLTVTASGPGWRSEAKVAPTWTDNDLITVALSPPRAPLHGELCIRNDGTRRIDVYAVDDRSRNSLARTTIGAREVHPNVQLTFFEAGDQTIAGRAGTLADQVTAYKPGFAGAWIVWPLALLVVLGPTVLLVAAMRRALRDS